MKGRQFLRGLNLERTISYSQVLFAFLLRIFQYASVYKCISHRLISIFATKNLEIILHPAKCRRRSIVTMSRAAVRQSGT